MAERHPLIRGAIRIVEDAITTDDVVLYCTVYLSIMAREQYYVCMIVCFYEKRIKL
jgi:hypothetical protein